MELIIERSSHENDVLFQILDSAGYIGNGWDSPQDESISMAPAIAEGIELNGNGDIIDISSLWVYTLYNSRSFVEDLQNDGVTFFDMIRYSIDTRF